MPGGPGSTIVPMHPVNRPWRSLLRWILLTAPARTYRRGEESGGAVPWIILFWMASSAAVGASLGAVTALIAGKATGDGAYFGFMGALGVVLAHYAYVILLIAALRVLNRPLENYLGEAWMNRPRRWWDG